MSTGEAPHEAGSNSTSSSSPQQLTIPFTSRSLCGEVRVTLRPNRDPNHAHGLDLFFPLVPRSDFPRQFFGFPVLHGEVVYPIPAEQPSYGCLFGWFQFVRCINPEIPSDADVKYGAWEMDIFPYAQDIPSPITYWGYNPSIFDAPARLVNDSEKIEEKEWRAQSLLGILEDAGSTKRVKLVPGVGFGWGFDIRAAEGGKSRIITIKGLEVLDARKEWGNRIGLLRDSYSAWTFLD